MEQLEFWEKVANSQEIVPLGAVRFDQGKPRMDLLDPTFLEGVAAVLTMGAEKYSPNNWKKGFNYSRMSSSLFRHLTAWMKGEDVDSESGLPHMHHIACNCMFIDWMMKNKPELDDRNVS